MLGKDSSGNIAVTFPYDPQLVAKVKTIEGRKWHKDKKYWSFPDADGTLEKILKAFEGEEIRIHRELAEAIDPALQAKNIPSPLVGEGEGVGALFMNFLLCTENVRVQGKA
ncbi:MAG: hypothetical protein HZA07_03460 [Nitrospirae bacterium]|nr:hypothetical protein [Nitrospirota bacterium]